MTGDPAGRPLRVVVCGTGFGRIHLRAVLARPDLRLVGILARGGDASRALATAHGVPMWTDVAEVPADVDLASVAVGAAVQGGPGSELVLALLARGIHVLQEHPAHPDEITAAARAARKAGVRYRLSTHYRHVRATRGFLASAERLRARSALVHVDAAGPVHLLQPLVDVLGLAVGGLRPWAFADPVARPRELTALETRPSPLTAIEGVVGGIPLSLRVHDELHPADRDNHALLWPRISLASEAGVLTLADVHGPVTWSPALHTRRDAAGRLDLDGDPARRSLPRLASWPEAPAPTAGELFDDVWPDAVGHALGMLVAEIRSGDGDALRSAQADITMARAWVDLTRRLGPPRSIRPGEPPRVTAAAILPAAEPSDAADGRAPAGGDPSGASPDPAPADPYGPAAELFDLAAAAHAELTAAAVCRLLDGRDLSAAPVLDIGAGTGVIARAVARAHPEARVVAAEPSEPLRAVLTARILDADGLQERVTVTAGSAPDLDLPDRLSAVLLCGVLGHLDPGQRARLWERIAERLLPDGVVVVETMGLEPGTRVPESRLARTRVGDDEIEWWFRADPAPDGLLALRTRWRSREPGGREREVHDAYSWDPVGLEALAREAGMDLVRLPAAAGASLPLGALVPRPTDSPAG
ncbi:thiazolinyl imide reductase [Clavibacter michiganensis]|uniref:Gfo/Idh/MocA family oxidoreductase n=1 Tax=Clavibacter michiganensis TaxID=28447 RepID=UPI00195DA09B|nr:Gfo/Idh/MocA family oxidoreductase [Clavibacter michiganensis]MBM7412543.1 thiazolinyl imide reductase [Clavibacter michiganensis]